MARDRRIFGTMHPEMTLNTNEMFETAIPRFPELSGKVAIVTGSSRGIGKGIAVRLAREGMRVVINGRTRDTAETTAGELRELGVQVLTVAADIGNTRGVDRLFAETLKNFGTVDLLVNNAALMDRMRFFDVGEELLDASIASNIRGPYLCAHRAAHVMRESNAGGSIINISSVGGARAHWRGLPYDVGKGAIDAMTRAMALELAEFGIRVNAVAPGATRTEKTPDEDDERVRAAVRRLPIMRHGTPLEIGAAVAFLASQDAAYITGQVLYVDGGLTAQLGTREQPT